VDLVRRRGAEHVIDYTEQDFTVGAARYDLALQLVGKYSPAAVRRVLTPRGTLIQSFGDGSRWFGPVGNIIKAVALNAFVGRSARCHISDGSLTAPLDRVARLPRYACLPRLTHRRSVVFMSRPGPSPQPSLDPRLQPYQRHRRDTMSGRGSVVASCP
jgi:hypothetical protein